EILTEAGFKIDICDNGAKAIQAVQDNNYDVVLMDIQMPVMDGYTATARIRELEREKGLRHIPVVALTAHTTNTEIRRCLDAGCDVHLAKPVSKNALIKLIAEITDNVDALKTENSDKAEEPIKSGRIKIKANPELIEMIPGYITHRYEDIKKLNTLLTKRQYRDIERCGHSMKGSGSSYGFDEISKIGAFIEKAGHSESIRRIEEGIEKLEQYLDNLEIVGEG
ncbi:MAG: response regulator, partial [Candidatus Aegiribacteria sp.]|nr:response regulator [Candidatus Aegiribacteria sp.]